ncbi:MAG: DUF2339 domain-containing protein [Betaproteobacteria bacterium]|nr:DUF2339 domain-containing protein [Betaproteobacteria bacterium]
MTFIFILLGILFGASIGSWGGAMVGAIAGWAIAGWIKAKDRATEERARADQLDQRLGAMQGDIKDLAARLSALEKRGIATSTTAAADASATEMQIEPSTDTASDEPAPWREPVAASMPDAPSASAPTESVPAAIPATAVALQVSEDTGVEPDTAAPDSPPVALPAAEPGPMSAASIAHEEPAGPGFIERLLEGNIVAKIGVVILFLGVGFLLKFAYDRGMFPPELRLIAVAAAGGVMLFIGRRLLESQRTYAIILMGAAFGLFYLDTFFALKTFALIGPVAGFVLFAALGVALLVTAVRLDARVLAAIGMLGAFLAPLLASTGGGNHVLLFSYYLLLNLIILGASWFKAWRELNFIGFLFTFAISLVWGYSNYTPKHFATVEPFLIAFFLLYLASPVLFAARQPPQLKGLVDGTLVFGMPLSVAMMQAALTRGMDDMVLAWSAAGAAAIYAAMARLLWQREHMRLLAEAHLALAVVFGTVAPYFAFSGYPTFAFWTLEGAAIYWMACRQDRILGRAFALLLQVGAAVYFWWVIHDTIDFRSQHAWFNDRVIGGTLIAGSAWLTAWFMRRYEERLKPAEAQLEIVALAWGALWVLYALAIGIARQWTGVHARTGAALLLLAALFVALDACGAWLNWRRFRLLARGQLPLLALLAMVWALDAAHPLRGLGLYAWPTAFVGYFFVLHRQRAAQVEASTGWRYAGAWALMLILASWEAAWRYGERQFDWVFAIGALGLAASAVRFALRGGPTAAPSQGEDPDAATRPRPSTLFGELPLLWSLVVWFLGLHGLIGDQAARPQQVAWHLGVLAASVALFEWGGRALEWLSLRRMQVLLTFGALLSIPLLDHPLRAGQGWAWLAVFAVSWWVLRRQERDGVAEWPGAQHVALIDLLIVLTAWELHWRAASVGLSVSWKAAALGAALAAGIALVRSGIRRDRWPFATHMTAFAAGSLIPGLLLAALWTLAANAAADGAVAPWPYLPLLNPFDLAQLALLVVAGRVITLASEDPATRKPLFIALAALAFWWTNAVLLRSVHQWADVPYQIGPLLASVVAQASLSLLWTSTALVIMFAAVRRVHRGWWMCGAALLALVVAKLAFNDLAQTGTVARIVSFIGVGVLLLVIGYVAPVPPKRAE